MIQSSLKVSCCGRKECRETPAGDPREMVSHWEKFLLNWLWLAHSQSSAQSEWLHRDVCWVRTWSHLLDTHRRITQGLRTTNWGVRV